MPGMAGAAGRASGDRTGYCTRASPLGGGGAAGRRLGLGLGGSRRRAAAPGRSVRGSTIRDPPGTDAWADGLEPPRPPSWVRHPGTWCRDASGAYHRGRPSPAATAPRDGRARAGPGPAALVRQSAPMDSRRGGRPPQVRPRPASFGRPTPPALRPAAPSPTPPRAPPPDRPAAGPAAALRRRLLAAGVVALGDRRAVGRQRRVRPVRRGRRRAASAGSWTRSARPSRARRPRRRRRPATRRSSSRPSEPYTNDDAVDVTVNVPAAVVGDAKSTRPPVGHGRRRRAHAARRAGRSGRPRVQLIPRRRAEQGPQRLPGVDRGARRRERALGGRDLGPRQLEAASSRSSRPRTARRPPRTPSRSRARPRPAAPSGVRNDDERRHRRRSMPTRTGCSRPRIAIAAGPERDP